MTAIAQFVIIFYLCSCACAFCGLWLIYREAAKILREKGYGKKYNTNPFDLQSIAFCLCPLLNAIIAFIIMYGWDTVIETSIAIFTEEEEANE
jgi:hypothetical protein